MIIITTSGRPYAQPTAEALKNQDVHFAVYEREVDEYTRAMPGAALLVVPNLENLSQKRQWLLENAPANKVILFDDDLRFFVRRKDDPTKFRDSTTEDIDRMVYQLYALLDNYAHVGVCPREGGNRKSAQQVYENERLMRVLGYDLDILRATGVSFDFAPAMSDFHMNLCLLEAGYPNAMLAEYCHNQFGSNTKGGCSRYRTKELLAECAHELHRQHPDYVTVVERETKGAWGGGVRTDVRIQWKKAYEQR